MLSSLVFASLQAFSFPPLQKSANSRPFLFNGLGTLCQKHPGVHPSAVQAPSHA